MNFFKNKISENLYKDYILFKLEIFLPVAFYVVLFASIISGSILVYNPPTTIPTVIFRLNPMFLLVPYIIIYQKSKNLYLKNVVTNILACIIIIDNIGAYVTGGSYEVFLIAIPALQILIFVLATCSLYECTIMNYLVFSIAPAVAKAIIPYYSIKVFYNLVMPVALMTLFVLYVLETRIIQSFKNSFEFKKEVFIDQLTGAYNRNIMNIFCDKETNCLNRRSCGLMLVNIDNFKYINDIYGHEVGDDCLKNLVNILKKYTDYSDVVRWDGDSFLVIVNDTYTTASLAEKLRERIKKETFFSISIGVNYYSNGKAFDVSMVEVEKALRTAKEHGKNKVFLVRDLEKPPYQEIKI